MKQINSTLVLTPIALAVLCLNGTAQAQIDTGNVVVLPAVQVRAKTNSVPIPDGYRATTTRATKSLQDPQDVPQAITTVTQTLMDEQQVGSLREALRNVSGLTFNAAEGGRSGDNMMLRGFYTFGDIYLDGVRDTAQYNRETFNTEQVDVLRGAAAMLYGRGQAGGVVNQATKTAQLHDKHQISTTIGNEGYYEAKGDFNKQLSDTSAIRINAMKRHEGNWRENPANGATPELKRQGVAIAYATGQGTPHMFNVGHSRVTNKDNPDYGVRFDPVTHAVNTRFPIGYYWGTDKTFDDSTTSISTVGHTYRAPEGSELKTVLRRGIYDRAYWGKTPHLTLAPDAKGAAGGNQTRTSTYKTTSLQSDFNTQFMLGTMSHEVLAGIELLKEDSYRQGLLNTGTATAPIYKADKVNPASLPNKYTGDSKSVYIQDSVEFIQDWKALVGIRKDWLDANYSSLTSPALKFSESSTRFGLSYQPSINAHYYLNTSDSFSPTADLYQLSGGAYPAERSKVLEVGAKWQAMNGNLALRTALYRADKHWERNTDLESTAAILTKKRRTNGLDLEVSGNVTPKLAVFAGASFMDAKILEVAENKNATTGIVTKADARFKGQAARNTPSHTFNLWSTYKVTPQFKLGGGIEFKGKRTVYSPQVANANSVFTGTAFTPNTAPRYTRFDMMAAYEFSKKITLRANIKNLTNKVYYDALYDNGGFAIPSNRRSATISVDYTF